MAKFKLEVKPTFKSEIQMPLHGGDTVKLEFEFKHRTRDQLAEWAKGVAKLKDVDLLDDVLAGWNIDEPYCRESLELLCQNFAGAPRVILDAYLGELNQARQKN
jgi:hypothetical protein